MDNLKQKTIIPKFFAGSFCIEDSVSGGTGNTPEEAIEDYLANYADDEIDYYTPLGLACGTFTVEVFDVYEPEPDDPNNEGEWIWMLGKRIEKREYFWAIKEKSDGMKEIVYCLV